MSIKLELIEQDELLDGIMVLTDGNVGLSHQLLKKVIEKTEREVKTTLKEIADNIDRETRNARRRGIYQLNRNMVLSSNHPVKPKHTAAHHIVALTDPRAEKAFKILLKWNIDFNHEANGVFLPRFRRHVPHKFIPDAIAHSQTHTKNYHANVVTALVRVDLVATSQEEIIEALREIATDLQEGTFPTEKLLRTT